jgi:genome maintenance exonuclease 1
LQYNHKTIELKKQPKLIEKYNKHFYETPEGKTYPSITTKLSKTKDYSGLNIWKAQVGEGVAKHIMENAGIIGTATHKIIEQYLNNETSSEKLLLPKAHLENIKPLLHKIDNIHFLEVALFSDQMETAGTCDCIAEYDGVLSIIDFKTSRKKKQKAWIQDYFLQATAYALMYKEMSGIEIKQGVILITGEDGSLDEQIINIDDYTQPLKEKLEVYTNSVV